jgi:hypothetical protein
MMPDLIFGVHRQASVRIKHRPLAHPRDLSAVAYDAPAILRIESQRISMQRALWTNQSRIADGILDSLVHDAHRIEMRGDSMR